MKKILRAISPRGCVKIVGQHRGKFVFSDKWLQVLKCNWYVLKNLKKVLLHTLTMKARPCPQVRTQGYVGLGFSPNGGMKGADVVLGWVADDGKVMLQVSHKIYFVPCCKASTLLLIHAASKSSQLL